MRKPGTALRRTILALALTIVALHAASNEELLLRYRIETADRPTLEAMVEQRGLESASIDEMRRSLYDYHTLEAISSSQRLDDAQKLTITGAEHLSRIAQSVFILDGGVVLSIATTADNKEVTITGERMIIDASRGRIIAEGSVHFSGTEEQGSFEGAVVVFDYPTNRLMIADGRTIEEHTREDGKTISLYTSAELVTSLGSGALTTYDRGVIATSPTDPLSSIRASRIAFYSGGDVMIRGATLYIGRVPMLWLPFFHFVENRMVGNPVLGLNSERGMFVSTTWEMWGRYPAIGEEERTSALTLLHSADDRDLYPGRVLYQRTGKTSAVNRWAEQSGSYLAFSGDVYERQGLGVGLDSHTSLLDGSFTFDLRSQVALPNTVGAQQDVRYWLESDLRFTQEWVTLSLSLPLYSDPSVKRQWANRLTGFSVEGALGKTMEFPTDIRSDINRTVLRLTGSLTLPRRLRSPYLSTLTLSTVKMEAERVWKNGAWELSSVTIPEVVGRAAGTLFSLKRTLTSAAQKKPADTGTPPTDDLLPAFYPVSRTTTSTALSASQQISLDWDFSERFIRRPEPTTGKEGYLYSLFQARTRLYATPHSRWLTIEEVVRPQLSIVRDMKKETFHTQEGAITSALKVRIPIAGLEYTLNQRLYSNQLTYTSVGGAAPVEGWSERGYGFTKEEVSAHSLSWSQTYQVGGGSLKPSLTFTLMPLDQRIEPSISGQWGGTRVALSMRWLESSGSLNAEQQSASVSYSSTAFTFQVTQKYEWKESALFWYEGLSLGQSITLFSSDKRYRFTEELSYLGQSKAGVDHWFERLAVEVQLPYLSVRYTANGAYDALRPLDVKASLTLAESEARFYKRRIALSWGLDTSLYLNFQDRWTSRFEFEAKIGLFIAEFLDLRLSVRSVNTGLFHYWSGDTFSLPLLFEDLKRSFDLFGDGRYSTQFTLDSINLLLVHDLGDWSLNCKYSGSVVLSNNQYSWVPTVSLYLSWNVLSELDIEERWTRSNDVWIRSAEQ